MKQKEARMYFWNGTFMYIGKALQTQIHDHHALQLILGLDEPFTMQTNNGLSEQVRAVIVNSDSPHECNTGDGRLVVLNIIPESGIGKSLKNSYLCRQGFRQLPESMATQIITKIKLYLDDPESGVIFNILDNFLHELSGTISKPLIDERILKLLKLLNETDWIEYSVQELAEMSFMSQSRLIHLFTLQVGIPIRKYILWQRLVSAMRFYLAGQTITQAALAAGFSDSPHFNKTIKRMFGLNMTSLLIDQSVHVFLL